MNKYNANGTIDTEIEHPVYGLIPCTVSKDDPDTAAIFDKIKYEAAPYEPPPPPTADEVRAELIKKFEAAVQKHLDDTAKSHGYDSILTAVTYAAYANPYQEEGQVFTQWRGDVWAYCYSQVDIYSGTVEEFILSLPDLSL